MISIRQIAVCLWLPGNISITRDFFGYRQIPRSKSVSLRKQVMLLRGKHIHVNLIRVATDENGLFEPNLEDLLDATMERVRGIYAKAKIGIGRIGHYGIPTAWAMVLGFDQIDDDSEAAMLTNAWTVHNNGLDIFLLRDGWVSGEETRAGLSPPPPGTCDKDDADEMTGSIVVIGGNFIDTAGALAHEVGHYLGLLHINGLNASDIKDINDFPLDVTSNMMFPVFFGSEIKADQAETMKKHCFVQGGC